MGGTNYGLVHTTISSGQWLTWENSLQYGPTLPATTPLDAYITVFLGSGKADLTINNGYLQEVDIARGTASNLVVLASNIQFDDPGVNGNPAVTGPNPYGQYTQPPTSVSIVQSAELAAYRAGTITCAEYLSLVRDAKTEYTTLSTQSSLVAGGTSTDLIFSVGPDTANVGIIAAEQTATLNLNRVTVKGDIQDIEGQAGKSAIYNVVTAGDLGCVTGGTIERIYIGGNAGDISGRIIAYVTVVGSTGEIQATREASYLNLEGCAGILDGGLDLINVTVKGNVNVLKATSEVTTVHVGGNAGIISSGNLLEGITVRGSSLSVGATKITNVQITGSVGFGVAVNADGSLGSPALGSPAFSISEAETLLGLTATGLASNPEGCLPSTSYIGGLEAAIANNVSVGGSISDLVISHSSTGSSALFINTVDNAVIYVGRGLFQKVHGAITKVPKT